MVGGEEQGVCAMREDGRLDDVKGQGCCFGRRWCPLPSHPLALPLAQVHIPPLPAPAVPVLKLGDLNGAQVQSCGVGWGGVGLEPKNPTAVHDPAEAACNPTLPRCQTAVPSCCNPLPPQWKHLIKDGHHWMGTVRPNRLRRGWMEGGRDGRVNVALIPVAATVLRFSRPAPPLALCPSPARPLPSTPALHLR